MQGGRAAQPGAPALLYLAGRQTLQAQEIRGPAVECSCDPEGVEPGAQTLPTALLPGPSWPVCVASSCYLSCTEPQ